MMKNAFALMVVAGLAGTAMASSVSNTFTVIGTASFSNKASMDVLNDADNVLDTWVATGGGTVNAIRVTGNITDGGLTNNWANDARVRFSPGAGSSFTAFNLGAASATQVYTGTIAVGPTQLSVPSFSLTSGGTVNLQWYEAFDEGAGVADNTWADVTYEFGFGGSTVTNGNFALGSLNNTGTPTTHAGSHVSGGLDFFTFSIADAVGPGGYLNIAMGAGATGSMTDTEFALYDSLGNRIFQDDDSGPGNYSEFSFGVADPNAAPDLVAGSTAATLAAGTYTLVTGGYNTVFATTLAGAHTPGTNVGNYSLSLTYVPAPGAMALLGLGGLVATRRRR